MAKISDLPLADPIDGSETFPLVQSGVSRRSNIGDYTNQLIQPHIVAIDDLAETIGDSLYQIDASADALEYLLADGEASTGALTDVTITTNNRDVQLSYSGYGEVVNNEGGYNVVKLMADGWQLGPMATGPNKTIICEFRKLVAAPDGVVNDVIAIGHLDVSDMGDIYEDQYMVLRDPYTMRVIEDETLMPGYGAGTHFRYIYPIMADGKTIGQMTHGKCNAPASFPAGQIHYFWPAGNDPRSETPSDTYANIPNSWTGTQHLAISTYRADAIFDLRGPTDAFARGIYDKIIGNGSFGRDTLFYFDESVYDHANGGSFGNHGIAVIGDSYSQVRERWTADFDNWLAANWGETGASYTSFAWTGGNGAPPYTISPSNQPITAKGSEDVGTQPKFQGAWFVQHIGVPASPGASLAHIYTTSPGAYFELTLISHASYTHFGITYFETTAGAFRYKKNAEVWVDIDCTGTEGNAVRLNIPAGVNDKLTVEHVSGESRFDGNVSTTTADGPRFYKFASNGSKATHWVTAPREQQIRTWATFDDVKTVIIWLGVNDRAQGETPDDFEAAIDEMCDRAEEAWPGCNIWLQMAAQPPEAGDYDMIFYSLRAAMIAVRRGFAFTDHQKSFGPVGTYGPDSANEMFVGGDLIHPVTTKGNRRFNATMRRFLMGTAAY